MGGARRQVDLVVLDVNETLFALDPLGERMRQVGLDGQLELWFTRVLRDGFAAAATGGSASFRDLAAHHLADLLRRADRPATDAEVEHVLAGFDEVVAHPDVAGGLRTLQRAGVPAVALTNGSADVTRAFLERSGLTDLVTEVHDVSEVGRWKPAPDPYRAVLERTGVGPEHAAMVAVHPWDVFGARSAGLLGAWLDRDGTGSYPPSFGVPDLRATDLDALVHGLLARRADR